MRVNALRLRAAACVMLCAAALSLAALAQGCARGTSAPAGGEANAPPQALFAASTQSQNTRPAPAPSPAVESPLPKPQGFVNDFANVIDERTEKLLETKFERLKANARIEFAVVTIETTGAQSIFDYSLALARGWGVGPPEGQDGGGLLLLFSIKDRQWRLQVSDRLMADLPNDETAEMAKVMRPSLQAGRYGEAVTRYADDLIKRLAERRGFSMQGEELNLQTSPEEKPKTQRP
ncbi:MAG: TPM domain-containing protein [Pyrinomonadaceae bacterium]